MYAELKRKICLCGDCKRCKRAAYRKANKEEMKAKDFAQDLKKHYGISVETYNNLWVAQDGRCACCGKHQSEFKRRLHVDHCHKNGKIRGLLCTRCNPGLGYFDDSIERLELAIKYLKKFQK